MIVARKMDDQGHERWTENKIIAEASVSGSADGQKCVDSNSTSW